MHLRSIECNGVEDIKKLLQRNESFLLNLSNYYMDYIYVVPDQLHQQVNWIQPFLLPRGLMPLKHFSTSPNIQTILLTCAYTCLQVHNLLTFIFYVLSLLCISLLPQPSNNCDPMINMKMTPLIPSPQFGLSNPLTVQ